MHTKTKKGQKCRRNDNRNQKNIEGKECQKRKKRYFMHSFRIERGEMENNISIQQDGKKRIFEEP